MIDTHVHLNDKKFKDSYKNIITDFKKDGIAAVVNVGYDRKSSETVLPT